MTTVGACDAKTHLPSLLDRVAKGESITITKRGRPVAVLVPPAPREGVDPRAAARALIAFRRKNRLRLAGLSVKELTSAGRGRSTVAGLRPQVMSPRHLPGALTAAQAGKCRVTVLRRGGR